MSQQDTSPSQESPSPWRFVRLENFRLPPEPTREKMRRGLLGIWDRLKRRRAAVESSDIDLDLVAVPGNVLAQAASEPDWQAGVPALHEALQDWWQDRAGRLQILIGPPYSGTAEIAAQWALARQCPVLPEPQLDQIKSGCLTCLEQIDQSPDRVWVIPRLERFYLRHSQGFTMLRALLENITASPARFLLTCDSWAWAYLSKALHINGLFPQPLILEAFNQKEMELWFRALATQTTGAAFVFRQADNGKLVLPPSADDTTANGEKQDITDFLPRLAAFSRGNPGVAHSIWRYSLRLAEKKEIQEKAQEAAANDALHQTIWVEPWSQLNLPSLAGFNSRDRDLFVLHTLLLHDGLSGQVLAQILPFPEPQLKNMLQMLQVAGIVVNGPDNWRVGARAYPAVREFLRYEGYLVDAL